MTAAKANHSLQFVHQGTPCKNTDNPEHIGMLQIYDQDFLGGNIVFKLWDVDYEKEARGAKYYEKYHGFNELFEANAVGSCRKLMAEKGWRY